MLHTFRRSPFLADIEALLRYVKPDDDVLLMEDGVIAGLTGSHALELLLQTSVAIHALREDVAARGLAAQISSKIVCVNYTDFVRLVVKHEHQFAW